jgi:membrane-bound lytic murein transglycosylase D
MLNYIVALLVCCLWFTGMIFTPFSACAKANETSLNAPKNSLPSLIESIQFNEPITFCGLNVPVSDPQVRERLEKEVMLALWDRPQVILWLKRASRFFPHIEKILKDNQLPLDLKYVPVIESALRPHARSSKNAVGYWQFLRSTGIHYGLRIDRSIDERRNIFKSTQAACLYLNDLNKKFNSYFLTLTAYNMGEYGLKSEIEAQQNNDFFNLYLPLETQRYVFKIIAAKLIFENQTRFGFYLTPKDFYPEFVFDRVNFTSDFNIPIHLFARAADTHFKTIKDYNPHIRGYYLIKGSQTILIPKGHAKIFKKNFNNAYADWKKKYQTRIHVVKRGESLIAIAKKYQMPLSSLLKLNGLSLRGIIHPGDRLIVE